MKNLRRGLLLVVLLGCVGAWLWLSRLESSYRAPYALVEDSLYIGGSVSDPPPGTTAVLNLCGREDPYRVEAHRWEPILDAGKAPGVDWLRRMVEFVDARRRAGATTYVHCAAGVSRSGLVVTAYLMHEHGWTRDEALAFVRRKRPHVRPNPAFMQLLAEWEQVLKGGEGAERK